MNVNDMLSMFGSPQVSEEAQRLHDVRVQLLDDRAIKEWQVVLDQIRNLLGDVRGQIEATTFCKVYLKKLVTLSGDVARETGVPKEVADILAFYLQPMFSFAVADRYEQITSDERTMEAITEQSKAKPELTDDEVNALMAEQETLKVIVAEQEAQAEAEEQEEFDDEDPCCNGKAGCDELDPKNPFGLN